MKTMLGYPRWMLAAFATAALLGGCSQGNVPDAIPPPIGASPGNAAHSLSAKSWMSPQAKNEDLIYVSDTTGNSVSVYAWMGRKLVGTLAGISEPYGLCSDKNGNVWVVGWGKNQLIEYAHAGIKPIKKLSVQDPYASLFDCSVDPLTGNLAVTDWGYIWLQGYVLVYPNASGTPTEYNGERLWYYYGCSYDDKGNLYADGWDAYVDDNFSLAVLRRGAKAFYRIHLLPQIYPPILGGVQWDGKYVAVGNFESVWEYSVKGHFANVAGNTQLTQHWPVGLFWIRRFTDGSRTIVAPDFAGHPHAVQYWKYPDGGDPIATVTSSLNGPFGVTVSVAKP